MNYVIIFVIYGYSFTVINLMKFRTHLAIGDFARITIMEHRYIFFSGKALDVRSRNSLGDLLMP